jgi:arylsulfatase A-like enzyme
LKEQPNLVVIYTDDLGYGDLGCFGSDAISTPHLDALANSGVRLTDWYSNSPVCSPSRASLLTGRYPHKTGVSRVLGGRRAKPGGSKQSTPGLPPDEKTIASLLKPHGYRTAMFGKWHLGITDECRPNAHGFDEFFGFLAGCVDYYSHIYYHGGWRNINPTHDLWHNEREVWYNGRYFTELVTEKSVDFIERGSDQPFFLYVPYSAPHYPMHAPKAYLDRYPDLPPDRRIMAAMISALDDGVGAIVKALKAAGEYENTMIFFSSDNGPSRENRNWLDGNEDHYYGGTAGIFRGHKGSVYEAGIREPTIMSFPGRIPGGQVSDDVGAMFDVLPTFFDFAGIEPPEDLQLDGKSVMKTVTEGAESPHHQIFWEYAASQLAIRQGNWKLTVNGRDDGKAGLAPRDPDLPEDVNLSDLETDPGERTNLAEQNPELTNQLLADLRSWADQVSPTSS